MVEKTYNKYKRQRAELMRILSIDVQRFLLDRSEKDIQERLSYLKKCMLIYRANKGITK